MANLIKIDLLLTSTAVCRKAPWFWMAQNEPEKAKAAEIYNSLLDCQERIIPEGRHFYDTFLNLEKAAAVIGCEPEEVIDKIRKIGIIK